MTIIIYISETDVAAYIEQGWVVTRLRGHHGARRAPYKSFMAVREL